MIFRLPTPRFALALAAGVATLALMAQNPATAGSPARLGSGVFDWEKLPFHANAIGGRRDVVNQPTATLENLECHVTTLDPGQISHPPHRHPQEEFIILRTGTVEVSLNGKPTRAGPGSLLFFAANDLHNLANVGEIPATYQVFQFTTAATRTVASDPAVRPAGLLASGVFDWEKLAVKTTPKGARRDLFDSPTATARQLECHVTTLNPGEIPHAAHRHPDEEFIVVKEGTLLVTINGATHQAGAGSIVFFASNDEHGLKNVGTIAATYYVLRIRTAATPESGQK